MILPLLAIALTQFAAPPSQGIPPPMDAAALSRTGLPGGTNPALLGEAKGLSVAYQHHRDIPSDRIGDGVWGAAGMGPVTLGISEEWVRHGGDWPEGSAACPDYRKTGVTLAVGGPVFTLGARLNFMASDESRQLDRMDTWDVGVAVRPLSWLSIGGAAMDLNGPDFGEGRLARRFDVGVGFRPGTDRVEIGGDWTFDDLNPLEESRIGLTVKGEVMDGVQIAAGFSTSAKGEDMRGQVGLTLRAGRMAAGYAFGSGFTRETSAGTHDAWAMASTERGRGMKIPEDKYAMVDVEAALRRPKGLSALLGDGEDGWLSLMAALDRIEDDGRVTGVVLKLEGSGDLGLARAEELANRVNRLRSKGKKSVAFLLGAEDADYVAALACDRIVAVPAASLFINGFGFSSTFFGRLVEKAEVGVDVVRSGRFKTAPEEFTRSDMSEAEREQMDACLDRMWPRYSTAIQSRRHLTEQQVKEALSKGVLSATLAKETGLVDDVVYGDQVAAVVAQMEGRPVGLVNGMGRPPDGPPAWGSRPKVALVRVDGLIAGGESESLLGERKTGAADVIRALQQAWEDDGVKAVALAIDSGGGSSAASDMIWRAVRLVAQDKPVVVSLGDVAASGGYYVASAGTEVFAAPSTLTGSIGVFIVKPSFGKLMEKVGVDGQILKRGESADLMSLRRPWTEAEKAAVQAHVDDAYRLFVDRVAEGRRMKREDVEAVAQGRVWLGSDALDRGLVDRMGGLTDALRRAMELGGVGEGGAQVVLLTGKGFGRRAQEAFSGPDGAAKIGGSEGRSLMELVKAGADGLMLDLAALEMLSLQQGHPLAVGLWQVK